MAAPIDIVDPIHPQPRRIAQAVRVLEAGGLVVYPTDTSYGIGCDLLSRKAIDRLYSLKRRDPKKPITFICADMSQAGTYAQVGHLAYRIIKRLAPGPYTFVLQATKEVPKVVTTKQKTVGVRIPDSPVALALVEGLGRPLLNTTATGEDGELIGDPREIKEVLGHGVDLILDAGLNLFDVSTVVDLTGEAPEVLREGKGAVDEI
jgi:tRNA threonylcarbamoyl adenosine modification protein (Sua5/YciO/YrdC/YwlC family)